MEKIKVLFVGVGSIARRHIRNLQFITEKRELSLAVDVFRHRAGSSTVEGVREEYHDVSEVPDDYDAIFITNPTELHLVSLRQFYEKGKHFFIEKPVVSLPQIEEAKLFPLRNGSIHYVACPLRYNAVIQYVKKNISPKEVISVRSISSSYLPDWRPAQDYRETYSAHKDMGGGVSIDLIHEWDYLTYLFGWPRQVRHMKGKKSALEIDSDDYAVYIAEYSDKIAELHLDYFGRKTIREIQLFTRNDTIIGDIANNQIKYLVGGQVIDFQEERDDFQRREIEHFLDMIEGISETKDGFSHGIKVLELTQGKI